MAGVNNVGLGGVNAHVLVEPNYKLETNDSLRIAEMIPRIVNICGRNEHSVQYLFDFIENNPKRVTKDFLALLTQTMKYTPNVNSSGMIYRGIILRNINTVKF
jgi:acyl transferase domain-containing protein